MCVNIRIEQSFPTAFGSLAVAGVFIHVRDQPMIEAGFTSTFVSKALSALKKAHCHPD